MRDIHQTLVGLISANLLPRPTNGFFGLADEISSEMVELARIFCKSNGEATRMENHPRMTGDAIREGGFLNIDVVEIHPDHRHQDLGLRFLHAFLTKLQGEWTLAVMFPAALGRRFCHWKENGPTEQQEDDEAQLTEDQWETYSQSLARQFARMGFAQAGPKMDQLKAWFLTAQSYFSDALSNINNNAATTISQQWLSKQQAAQIQIRQVPKPVEPTGLDKELKEAVRKFPEQKDLSSPYRPSPAQQTVALQNIEALILRGASVNNSCSLQTAAANIKDPRVLLTLVRLGGDINHRDAMGNTALHVAATLMRHEAMEALMGMGANRQLRNLDNETPLECVEKTEASHQDFWSTFSQEGTIHESVVLPTFRSIKALTTPAEHSLLIDGWLSPRMKFMLEITAEFGIEMTLEGCEVNFKSNQPTSLEECCGACGINLIEYIPASVLKSNNPRGLYASFNNGWGYCFLAVHSLLRRGEAPTVNRVEDYLSRLSDYRVDRRKFQHFKDKGGKVEFALDAVIDITRKVAVNGNDAWEYHTYEADIENLPATPLDRAFDIVRYMSINQGGGDGKDRGPYRETQIIGLRDYGGMDDDDEVGDY